MHGGAGERHLDNVGATPIVGGETRRLALPKRANCGGGGEQQLQQRREDTLSDEGAQGIRAVQPVCTRALTQMGRVVLGPSILALRKLTAGEHIWLRSSEGVDGLV